ncbi:MAG: hypothetical protein PHP42_12595 [Bacteroidota bacterium]|nr:hypothetical protein [Bacteroidota bacterium]
MKCPRCQTENDQTNEYCRHCGNKLFAVSPAFDEEFSTPISTTPVFSEKELKILLDVSRKTSEGSEKRSSVTQNEIDKLFG